MQYNNFHSVGSKQFKLYELIIIKLRSLQKQLWNLPVCHSSLFQFNISLQIFVFIAF